MGSRAGLLRRLVVVAVAVAAAGFAIEGGEYGTWDLFLQRREKARLTHSIDSLQRTVDSLRRYEAAVRTDPATQERIAREVFGMVRSHNELLYRFVDSTRRDK
jgi:cell division protein FtsB